MFKKTTGSSYSVMKSLYLLSDIILISIQEFQVLKRETLCSRNGRGIGHTKNCITMSKLFERGTLCFNLPHDWRNGSPTFPIRNLSSKAKLCQLKKHSQPKSQVLHFIRWECLGLQAREAASLVTLRELLQRGEQGARIYRSFTTKGR